MTLALFASFVTVVSVLPAQTLTGSSGAVAVESKPAEGQQSATEQQTANNTAALLETVPADAQGLLVLRNLGELDQRLAPLFLASRWPLYPVRFLRSWFGIVDGLDERGSAAVVLLPPLAESSDHFRLAVFLPTSDLERLRTMWDAQPLDGGFFKVTVAGHESHLGQRGAYAVLAEDLATVRAVVDAKTTLRDRLSPHHRASLETSDVCVWLHTGLVSSDVLLKTVLPSFAQCWGIGTGAFEDARSIMVSTRVENDGVHVGITTDHAGGRPSPASLNTEEPLLIGLPGEPFYMAMGMVDDANGTQIKAMKNWVIPLLTSAGILDAGHADSMAGLYDSVVGKVSAASVSIAQLPASSGGTIGLTKVLRARGDSRELLVEVEAALTVLQAGPFVDARFNALASRLVYRRSAERLDGLSIDHLYVDVQEDNAAEYAKLKRIVGQEGLLWRIAAVDGTYVVVALGGGLPRLKSAIEAVRSGAAPLASDPRIAGAAKHVAGARSAEMYLSVDRLTSFMKQAGEALGVKATWTEQPEVTTLISLTVRELDGGFTETLVFIPLAAFEPPASSTPADPTSAEPSSAPPPPRPPE